MAEQLFKPYRQDKLDKLTAALKAEKNKNPGRSDVIRIIGVSYPHAGVYLKAWKESQGACPPKGA
jgi:hypothetical protein